MLELRYAGCPGCLKSAQTILRRVGYTAPQNYRVEFHSDHRSDKIYQIRPDYLKEFNGAILYNPDTQHWVDFYDKDHEELVLTVENEANKKKVASIIDALSKGA